MLGLQDLLPIRRRRVGACAAAMLATTLTLPALIDVAPVAAEEAPEDIADRLIASVAGYVVAPEGTGGGDSRAVTLEDLATLGGTDLPDLGGDPPAGYLRFFRTPAGDGVAAAFGFDLSAGDAADFLDGFHDAGEHHAAPVPVFPGAASPLGDVVAYEITDPASSLITAVTAFAGVLVLVGVPVWLIVRAARGPKGRDGVGTDETAPRGSVLYPARRPGIPLPPLDPRTEAPPPSPPPDGDPARRPGIPLPPREPGSAE